MTILDTAILNLMKELENKEISWEEYKLKLNNKKTANTAAFLSG